MVPLLTDLHLAGGYSSQFFGDSTNIKMAATYKAVFKKYGTDSATIRKSLSYYAERPEELVLMYGQVEKRFVAMQNEEERRVAAEARRVSRKLKMEEATRAAKRKVEENRAKMLKGKYDFDLPLYPAPGTPYLNIYKKYPVVPVNTQSKTDSLKTDSLKRDSLLKNSTKR
jgi:hypothetical protein